MSEQLSEKQLWYANKRAKELGITVEEYRAKYGKGTTLQPKQPTIIEPIAFDKVTELSSLNINQDMLKTNRTGLAIDNIISYESGIPVGTNIMCTGDPGVGKTTVLLHTLAHLQSRNPELKCLFVCGEMSKIQMYKYMQRFPIFGCVKTIFTSDYLNYNIKDVIEQLMTEGYDYVLVDSIAEVLEGVKEDNSWSIKQAEKWLIDLCINHNEGNNNRVVYTSFLLIQQVTKHGVFIGSNKLKHITDGHMEMRREAMKDGGSTYIVFTKNRNGQADIRWPFQLTNTDIYYGHVVEEDEGDQMPTTYEVSIPLSSRKVEDIPFVIVNEQ
jgi:DNA repair protein RadA/Sms